MNIERRHLLFAAATMAATKSHSAQAHTRGKRVSQEELDEAIRLHGMWLADMTAGQRCSFAGRDLSGLKFGGSGDGLVNLNGADFAQADLSGTVADKILVHHCNFHGAKFDGCHWRRPVFAYADMRRASAKGVEWGTRGGPRDSAERSPADFSHAFLHDADLSQAQICGYFYATKLVDVSMVQSDLSVSDLMGSPKHCETTFSGSNLRDAKLRDCRISAVSFFNANCSGADFSHSVFSDVRMKGCNLSRARFQGTEIERTMFSSDQIRDANFGTLT
jgi:uncharacterized protein YjbI with pentapeptide repeats